MCSVWREILFVLWERWEGFLLGVFLILEILWLCYGFFWGGCIGVLGEVLGGIRGIEKKVGVGWEVGSGNCNEESRLEENGGDIEI